MTHHRDDLPSRRITISTTTNQHGRKVVSVSRHERGVVPMSRHERETVAATHHCNGQTCDDDSDCDDDSPLQRRIIVAVAGQYCGNQFTCGDAPALRRPD